MDTFISREAPYALRRCAGVTLAVVFSAWFSGSAFAERIQTMGGRFAGGDEIDRLPWHPEGLVAVLGDERGRKWDLYGRGLAVRPDGRQLAAGGGSGAIYLLNSTTLRIERVLHGHAKHVLAVQYSADGRTLASIGADKEVRIWDLAAEDATAMPPLAVLDETPYRAVWSDDGTTLVIGRGQAQVLQVWRRSPQGSMQIVASTQADDAARREVLRDELRGLATTLNARSILSIGSPALAVSPDGGQLADASGGHMIFIAGQEDNVSATTNSTVTIRQIGDAEIERQWTIEGIASVTAMSFAPSGRLLGIGSRDGRVRLFDLGVDPPEVLHTLVHDEPVSGLRFDPRGRRMAVVAESLYLWDLSRHPPARTDVGPVPATNGLFQQTVELAFDPVESRLFYAQGNTVRRLDLDRPLINADPQRESTLTAVQSLAFTPDGRHLIAAVDRQGSRTVACWDFTSLTNEPAAEIETGESLADDITISPDGRFFVFSAYKNDGSKYTLELWERTKDGPVTRDVADLEMGHPGSFWCTAFSPNGMTLASGHRDGRIRFWDVSKGRLKQLELNAYVASAGVGGIDFAPDGTTLASVDWDGRVGLWNLTGERGFRKDIFARHDARAYMVRYSPDGRLLASGDFEGGIKLTNLAAEEPHSFNLELHTGNITALEFTPDGRTLLSSGADGRVILWDVDTNEPRRQWHFPGHVHAARFDPSGQYIVSANGNGTIYVWRP